MMRRLIAAAVLLGLVASARPARAITQGEEAGRAIASVGLNIFYIPAKAVMAVLGMVAGGFVGVATGGDERASYAVLVPVTSGTWFVTPDHIEGSRPIEFFGSDYADTPSELGQSEPGRGSYDAMYAM
jgi:hypothetical protein